ncbi:WecB/TagA/CpsF family glycosyltransferase [Reichenbachiella sp.]|uniref:WecB/TagA/CpsF family glycosyltransferase n=1 Tax=Reichenbachiella sp. TaxID=2184521 RepID=UPI003B58C536
MDFKKYKLFLPEYAAVDYDKASDIIVANAASNKSYAVSALAVHGLITSMKDKKLGKIINNIDLIVPDGQPIKWALNSLYNLDLKDRVYGPFLTLKVLEKANTLRLKVYLFGSTSKTIGLFKSFIEKNYPDVILSGIHVDRFREATEEEDLEDIKKINESGAHIVLVGRGCPRQEYWVATHKNKVNSAMMAVGAAFDFHAGVLPQAPEWMQKRGLEWFFRLCQEPKRLWKRYLVTNTLFILEFIGHKFFKRTI